MRPLVLAFAFLYFLSLCLAAPTASSSTDGASHTAASSNSTFASTSTSHSSSTARSSSHRAPIHNKPHPTANIPGPRPLPNPTRTRNPPPPPFTGIPDKHPVNNHSGQRPIAIAFEVLGGVFAGLLLLSFLRCCNNYRKTPRRDRIAEIVHRHNLQRELEELERNPRALRRPSLPEPAPPYFPRPPSYDTPPSQHSASSHSHRSERSVSPSVYSAVSTYSPSSTPPMSEVPLPSIAVNRRGHPQYPSG
ncbi:hypothetical protein D9619_000494 [Psilocybe cf. subviscida]|uniref:Transmembrane protein n=1 Tax=Psilocybe cf. subviscida TaxID=2480587 RepID=A0A8H5BD86_9AGAR|nr:hypothetical protein D9619_000494 [Psilocybe cf. subviscida]